MPTISRRAALKGLPAFALFLISAGCGSGGGHNGSNPSPPAQTGTVVSRSVVATYTRAQLDGLVSLSGVAGVPPSTNDVQMVELTYTTTGTDGKNTTASGLLALPSPSAANAPLVVYHHGTTFDRTNVPSVPNSTEALALAALFAGQGYAVAAPDYIGLGKSTQKQTFEYAAGLVPTTLDIIRAARTAAPQQGVSLSNKLFLTGYSEGGYAALAAQRAMEQATSGEFVVTASAPMAGPYDLSNTTIRYVLANPTPENTAFVAGILSQQNDIGHFYSKPSDAFLSPYDTSVTALFDGSHSDSAVLTGLPPSLTQLLTPAFIQAVSTDVNHPVNVYLRANDVYDFTPIAPTRFFHGKGDTTVPFANAEVAVARMTARGAQNVSLVNVGDTLDHDTATVPSFLGAKAFFDGLR